MATPASRVKPTNTVGDVHRFFGDIFRGTSPHMNQFRHLPEYQELLSRQATKKNLQGLAEAEDNYCQDLTCEIVDNWGDFLAMTFSYCGVREFGACSIGYLWHVNARGPHSHLDSDKPRLELWCEDSFDADTLEMEANRNCPSFV